jgi:hypothetical protein
MLRLVEALEEHDDVQKVSANFDIDEKEMQAVMAAQLSQVSSPGRASAVGFDFSARQKPPLKPALHPPEKKWPHTFRAAVHSVPCRNPPRTNGDFFRVLGVDPAAAGATGYGVIESDGRRCRMLRFGALRATRKGPEHFPERLREIHALLGD